MRSSHTFIILGKSINNELYQGYNLQFLSRPMSSFSHFSVVAQICRASSPQQINCPDIHQLSRKYIEQMFPSGPRPFSHPDCLEEALELATEYNLPVNFRTTFWYQLFLNLNQQIQKGILYSLVTTSNFDTETDEVAGNATIPADGPTVAPPISLGHSLSPSDAQRCQRLVKNMMDHFTPILFTVGTTSHMACTDVLADTWMPLVIQPALANDGVYKPLETLQSIIDIDWAKHGLCELCIIEKRAEWQGEQEDIWERMNGWVD